MPAKKTIIADPRKYPRFAGVPTFCRYPLLELVPEANRPVDWAVYGFPFDEGVTYHPGARFGLPGADPSLHLALAAPSQRP